MRSSIPIAITLLFIFTVLSFGFAFAEECIVADEESASAANDTVTNETLVNDTLTNETLNNITLVNESLENASLINESLENATLSDETLKNSTMPQNETSYFDNVRGRQPKRK